MASYKVKCKDYCDDYALHDVINYITQIYKTPHRMIGAYGVRPGNAAMQMEFVARAYNKYTGQRLRHSILSFSENDHVTLEQAYIIADAAARFYKDQKGPSEGLARRYRPPTSLLCQGKVPKERSGPRKPISQQATVTGS